MSDTGTPFDKIEVPFILKDGRPVWRKAYVVDVGIFNSRRATKLVRATIVYEATYSNA